MAKFSASRDVKERQNIPSKEYTGSKAQLRKLERYVEGKVGGGKARDFTGDPEYCFVTEI